MTKLSKVHLLAILEDIRKSIENDDSFEGRFSYTCMKDGLAPDEFNVECVFRVGNSEGQGGVIVL